MSPLAALWLSLAVAQPIAIRATPVPLDPRDPTRTVVGDFELRSGLVLTSDDRRFGGLSGLALDGEHLIAVTDRGAWLRAALLPDKDGRLTGLGPAEVRRLEDPRGKVLRGDDADAEEIALLDGGSFVVTFENDHRLWRYELPSWRPTALPRPAGLESAPANGGIEAMVLLPNGRLLAVAEKLRAGNGLLRGWIVPLGPGAAEPLTYAIVDELRPSGFARLPGGDVLAIERKYRATEGITARLCRIRAADIGPGAALAGRELARITGKMTADNFEGVTARVERGRTIVYLVTDDNYASDQRTLLFQLELRAPSP